MKLVYITDLEGDQLDWAVASVLNMEFSLDWKPTVNWVQGGPLIEKYRIQTFPCTRFVRVPQKEVPWKGSWISYWKAEIESDVEEYPEQTKGDTLLMAAMRALVLDCARDKNGLRVQKIEVPEGL